VLAKLRNVCWPGLKIRRKKKRGSELFKSNLHCSMRSSSLTGRCTLSKVNEHRGSWPLEDARPRRTESDECLKQQKLFNYSCLKQTNKERRTGARLANYFLFATILFFAIFSTLGAVHTQTVFPIVFYGNISKFANPCPCRLKKNRKA
jgi:hypothetical protein